MQDHPAPAPPRRRNIAAARRPLGAALLAAAAAGTAITTHAVALSQLHLWSAVLLVQTLALAAVAGMALLAVPPRGLARRATPKA